MSACCFSFCPAEEAAAIMGMSGDERGLFYSLRIYAWNHGGVPSEERTFLKTVKNCSGFSLYKIRKLLPEILKFFTLFEDVWLYEPDEQKRSQVIEINAKRKEAGRLGAQSKWSRRSESSDSDDLASMANAIRLPSHVPSGQLASYSYGVSSNSGEEKLASYPPEEKVEDTGPPDEEFTNFVRKETRFPINGMVANEATVQRLSRTLKDQKTFECFRARFRAWCRRNTPESWGIIIRLAEETRTEIDKVGKPPGKEEENRIQAARGGL
jgi:hypothetical protein